MSTEEKQNSPIYRDSNSAKYPESEKELSEIIRQAYKLNIPTELIGTGSKRKIGKPLQCAQTLNLSKLSGIIEYLPEELYIKVKACTPIDQIEVELRKNMQQSLARTSFDFFSYFVHIKFFSLFQEILEISTRKSAGLRKDTNPFTKNHQSWN